MIRPVIVESSKLLVANLAIIIMMIVMNAPAVVHAFERMKGADIHAVGNIKGFYEGVALKRLLQEGCSRGVWYEPRPNTKCSELAVYDPAKGMNRSKS